ncbi:cytochrome c-type biogenesis protein CcmE [Erythrobacter litoralis]|jgi:cytochrome c-type biogenesis protein CcmE|uniref:Cytochrome c-type biogenesis protein CcmE n=1 Tax=Erythrobacter litoralis TaxID=39960 RepID=A0A074NLK5_9SPHN|nr:cytochrome c maturation protein CcmE [Erythrobacter litoralis]AOL23901.1 cytochrome c-type biogenesis protein CcmE [Erythrobacter litoralis]KEO98617.1 cytochrome C biogenesis protein CcmE [Erythrobacter litoralis]MEE4337358.1 cytochrome c maturation protein CcmE [Erythrobacter sp.]
MNTTTGLKAKHQRMVLVVIALVAIIGAGLLAVWGLRNQANYFYLPEQMAEAPPSVGQAVRLGGMVQPGSIETMADGVTVRFIVTGNEASTIPVRYSGILPDLFVEGSGVVAEGSLQADGTFLATNLLAKHDENYVPRELEGLEPHQKAETVAETTVGIEPRP